MRTMNFYLKEIFKSKILDKKIQRKNIKEHNQKWVLNFKVKKGQS
jgi:hypothetical protein